MVSFLHTGSQAVCVSTSQSEGLGFEFSHSCSTYSLDSCLLVVDLCRKNAVHFYFTNKENERLRDKIFILWAPQNCFDAFTFVIIVPDLHENLSAVWNPLEINIFASLYQNNWSCDLLFGVFGIRKHTWSGIFALSNVVVTGVHSFVNSPRKVNRRPPSRRSVTNIPDCDMLSCFSHLIWLRSWISEHFCSFGLVVKRSTQTRNSVVGNGRNFHLYCSTPNYFSIVKNTFFKFADRFEKRQRRWTSQIDLLDPCVLSRSDLKNTISQTTRRIIWVIIGATKRLSIPDATF